MLLAFFLAERTTFAQRALAAATRRARMAEVIRRRAFGFTEGFRFGVRVEHRLALVEAGSLNPRFLPVMQCEPEIELLEFLVEVLD